ncbi:MAG: hypothetical protein HRT74_02945 [Flavobacteriales bacterium]|nr:hypothetical protein [Flavobacteriales bacterium]
MWLSTHAKWVTVSDYKKAEPEIKKALNWLRSKGLHECKEERSDLNAYVMLWLSESPYLTIEVNSSLLPFLKDDADLLFVMIQGMAQYQLKHPKEEDALKIHKAGLEYLAQVVKQSRKYLHKKSVKPLLKAARKKQLDNYIQEYWK